MQLRRYSFNVKSIYHDIIKRVLCDYVAIIPKILVVSLFELL